MIIMSFSENQFFWTDFINLYKEQRALWDHKNKHHSNKIIKMHSYNILVEKAKEIFPKADERWVRSKIENLRSSFRRELKKVEISKLKSNGLKNAVHEPTLWYFNLLMFTKDETSASTPAPAAAPPPAPSPPAVPKPAPVSHPPVVQLPPPKKFKSTHVQPYTNKYPNQYPTANDNPPPPQQNQRLVQEREVHICSSCPCIAAQETEYDKIGKAWASELQNMNPDQQIYAKRAIAEIIYEGQLGTLHRDSVIINHIDQRVADESSPYVVEKEEPDFEY